MAESSINRKKPFLMYHFKSILVVLGSFESILVVLRSCQIYLGGFVVNLSLFRWFCSHSESLLVVLWSIVCVFVIGLHVLWLFCVGFQCHCICLVCFYSWILKLFYCNSGQIVV